MSAFSSSRESKPPASTARSSLELREPLLLDLLDRAVEGRLLAGQRLGLVVLGERHLDLAVVAGGGSLELVLETWDQAPRAELEHEAAGLAALERLPVGLADEVEHHEVALLRGAVDVLERGQGLPQALELRVDLLGVDLRLTPADLDLLVVAELRRGPDADLERELERIALLGEIADLDLGVSDRGHLARR